MKMAAEINDDFEDAVDWEKGIECRDRKIVEMKEQIKQLHETVYDSEIKIKQQEKDLYVLTDKYYTLLKERYASRERKFRWLLKKEEVERVKKRKQNMKDQRRKRWLKK